MFKLFGYIPDKFHSFLIALRKGYNCQSLSPKAVDDWKCAHGLNFITVVVVMDISEAAFTTVYEFLKSCFWCTLQWRHNERDSVSNHQPHDCLFNCLLRRRSKETSKLRVAGICGEITGDRWIPHTKGHREAGWPVIFLQTTNPLSMLY